MNESGCSVYLVGLYGIVVCVLCTVTFDLRFRMLGLGASLANKTFYKTFYLVFYSSLV